MKLKLLLMLLALGMCCIGANAQTKREKKVESDGFVWYEVKQNGKIGAEDKNGKTIIPTRYDFIIYWVRENQQGYFCIERRNEGYGAYERNGMCVIPVSRGYTSVHKSGNSKDGFYYSVKKGGYQGVCDLSGHEVISPTRGYTSVCKHGDSESFFYYGVKKGLYEGVCDLNGREVISPTRGYTSVWGEGDSKRGIYYGVRNIGYVGACDLNGKEIIPPQYESLIYSSIDHVFEYKNSRGEFVSTGIPLTVGESSYAYYSSTSSSSSNGSSSSNSSSKSSSFDYEFTFPSYHDWSVDIAPINNPVTISISKSGKIKISFIKGGNTETLLFTYNDVELTLQSTQSTIFDNPLIIFGFGEELVIWEEITFSNKKEYITYLEDGSFNIEINGLSIRTSEEKKAKDLFKKIKNEMCH